MLVSDPDLLAPGRAVPGGLHRNDLTAVWSWLVADAVLARIDRSFREAADAAVEAGLRFPEEMSPALVSMSAELVGRCAELLDRPFSPGGDPRAAADAIAALRRKEDGRTGLAVRPFDVEVLALLRDVAVYPDAAVSIPEDAESHWPGTALLPVLAAANGRGDFKPVADLCVGRTLRGRARSIVETLLTVHLRVAAGALSALMEARMVDMHEDGALADAARRLAGAADAWAAGGFDSAAVSGPLVEAARAIVGGKRSARRLKHVIVGAAVEGAEETATAALASVVVLHRALPECSLERQPLERIIDDSLDALRDAGRQAVSAAVAGDPRGWRQGLRRLEGVLRVAETSGRDLGDWFSVIDHGILRIGAARLRDGTPLSHLETRLFAMLATKARQEVARCAWRDPVVTAFLEAVESRRPGGAPV